MGVRLGFGNFHRFTSLDGHLTLQVVLEWILEEEVKIPTLVAKNATRVGHPPLVGREKNMGIENVPRCQHVKMNGTQCGSPALRRKRHCFFHDRIRRERAKIARDTTAQRRFDLPLLEDANSVQVGLMKVIQMLGSGRMDHKTAGLILYALQTASVNLRIAQFEVRDPTDVVIDRDDVHRTCIGGPQWVEEDFEGEAEAETDEDETGEEEVGQDEAGGQAAIEGKIAKAEAAPDDPLGLRHVSIEEARKRVRGVIQNWVLETVGEKIGAKPS